MSVCKYYRKKITKYPRYSPYTGKFIKYVEKISNICNRDEEKICSCFGIKENCIYYDDIKREDLKFTENFYKTLPIEIFIKYALKNKNSFEDFYKYSIFWDGANITEISKFTGMPIYKLIKENKLYLPIRNKSTEIPVGALILRVGKNDYEYY